MSKLCDAIKECSLNHLCLENLHNFLEEKNLTGRQLVQGLLMEQPLALEQQGLLEEQLAVQLEQVVPYLHRLSH